MKLGWKWLLVTTIAVAGACDVDGRKEQDGGGGGFVDAALPVIPDAAPQYGDADIPTGDGGCAPATCQNPVADGCVIEETCNDGLDNDCDGVIDEDCTCTAGAVQSCFLGPPGRDGVGACMRGTQTCEGDTEFGHWGPCTGGIFPGGETCDGLDNNCNGCDDDNPLCCDVLTQCPESMPPARPFTEYLIDGANFFGGSDIIKWTWKVAGGPCDTLLAPNQSFKLNGAETSSVSGPGLNLLKFLPTLSGDYTVTVTVKHADGREETCTFIVHVAGPGLRIELCWEKTGSADVDLHVHRGDTTTNWGSGPDDCYYANCNGSDTAGARPNWGLPDSPLAECIGTPDGASWQTRGSCANPRLDIDNVSLVGKPENINIDTPRNGDKYRVGVHYFSSFGSSTNPVIPHPIVNVYCGGTRLGTFGQIPDQLQNFNNGRALPFGPMWRVVDVVTRVDASGVTTGCELTPLTLPSDPTQPYVTCPVPGSADDCQDMSY